MAGPVTLLEWLLGRPVITGPPAQGLFAAYLVWGLTVGLLFPYIHRPLHSGLDDVAPQTTTASIKSAGIVPGTK